MRINFTTYDCRRDQDTINVGTHSDIMVLANQDEDPDNVHPYWYARIIGIFHALVQQVGLGSTSAYEHMDFLWVRWYGLDVRVRSGFKAHRLHQIGFLDGNDLGAFGFVDPQDLIRAVHLIPAFKFGKTSSLLSQSIARREDEGGEDYERYYVNMYVFYALFWYDLTNMLCGPRFVDRDMFMRFCGLGPGHCATRSVTKVFRDDVRAIFGTAHHNEGDATSLDAEGQQDQRDVEGDPDDDSVDGDSSEEDLQEEDDYAQAEPVDGNIILEDDLDLDYAPL